MLIKVVGIVSWIGILIGLRSRNPADTSIPLRVEEIPTWRENPSSNDRICFRKRRCCEVSYFRTKNDVCHVVGVGGNVETQVDVHKVARWTSFRVFQTDDIASDDDMRKKFFGLMQQSAENISSGIA